MIDATYGHLVPDAEEYLRGLPDAYDDNAAATTDAAGQGTEKEAGRPRSLKRGVGLVIPFDSGAS